MILRTALVFALIIGALTMIIGLTLPLSWGPTLNPFEALLLPGRFIGWVCIWGDNVCPWQRLGETTISMAVNMSIGFLLGVLVAGGWSIGVRISGRSKKTQSVEPSA